MNNLFKAIPNSNKALILKTALLLMIAWGTSFSPAYAIESTIFEGYSKVNLSGVHSGYTVQRYTFDPTKKRFKSIAYLYVRLNPAGTKYIAESYVTESNEKLHPLSHQYTGIQNGKTTTIDSEIKNNLLKAKVIVDGKTTVKQEKVPKGAFFSSMLLQLLLQNGLSVGKNFSFNTILEEKAKVVNGTLRVVKEQNYNGINAHRLEYKIDTLKSTAYVSDKGHVLAMEIPTNGVSAQLVADPAAARANFPFPQKTLKTLFGNIPTGKKNTLAERKSKPPGPQVPTDTLKTRKSVDN